SPPASPRAISPRIYQSEPVTIRRLPDSASLLCGPQLSPPPPARFRTFTLIHLRTRSELISHDQIAGSANSFRLQPSSSSAQPPIDRNHGAKELRNSDHCDHSIRGAGHCGLRYLCDPKSSQPVRETRERGRGGRRRGITLSGAVRVQMRVRFQLDDNDLENKVSAKARSISGMLRSEDGRDTWF
ncbi:uncharacterized protein A1O5_00010, partial [Cladophialophora psammophila CBS 110553]